MVKRNELKKVAVKKQIKISDERCSEKFLISIPRKLGVLRWSVRRDRAQNRYLRLVLSDEVKIYS